MINVNHLHIYTVRKKILYCGECSEKTDPTHSFSKRETEFGKSFFFNQNLVIGISSQRIFWGIIISFPSKMERIVQMLRKKE